MSESARIEAERTVPRIGRSSFLKSSLVAVVAVGFGRLPTSASASDGSKVKRFIRLSRLASGTESLPTEHAAAYLEALEADGVLKLTPSRFAELAGVTATGGPTTLAELEQSAAYKAPGGAECLRAVAAAWWSGAVPTPGGGEKVVTFSDALVWRQVHEPMTCEGATGSWSKPGRAIE